MSIIVTGSIALDDIATDHGDMTDVPGGSAYYFSAAASLFYPVTLIAVVGEDFPADDLAFLRARGVNLDRLEIIPGGRTFRWGGRYETDMNRRTTTNLELNVFQTFSPVLTEREKTSKYVFLGNIDPDLQLHVLDQAHPDAFIGADTIECYIQEKTPILRKVLRRVHLLMINDDEARLLTGEHNLLKAAAALRSLGPVNVVVKKGEHGSILATPEGIFVTPAYPLDTVLDPTGAGDTYAGATMGWIARANATDTATLRSAIVHGGVVASFTVEDFGLNRLKTLTPGEVDARFARFRDATRF